MADVVKMPRLSDTMTEGKVAKWHKALGDTVNEGDILAEIETDKAVQDFESEFEGKILYIGVPEGESGSMDSILCIIGEEGEDISALISGGAAAAPKEETPSTPAPAAPVAAAKPAAPAAIPEGVYLVTLPRLTDTMENGKIGKWLKNVGDKVNEGDVIVEIETDKAVQDFESEFEGTLLYQGLAEGETGDVEALMAIIGPAGTDVSGLTSGVPAAAPSEAAPAAQTAEKPLATVAKEAPAATSTDGRIAISPLAKKMAEEKGIDIHSVQGTGDGGRIVKRDIENYQPTAQPAVQPAAVAAPAPKVAAAPTLAPAFLQAEDTETPNSQMRSIIARRLGESKFTAPHYYLIMEIDMDKAIAMRKELNSIPDTKISFNDMVVKATAVALRKHPQVNSTWYDDKIVHHGNINIGVAVAVADGLVVPVLRNTDYMSYGQISAAVKDMAGRARSKGLKANEMEGSTFTISNLGMYGIETFTSIINQPNSAILSVGAIIEKPVVKNGEIVVGHTMKVSLACDHRVVDGATGSEFLQTLKTYLENPLAMLI